jgi:hypothetical protein
MSYPDANIAHKHIATRSCVVFRVLLSSHGMRDAVFRYSLGEIMIGFETLTNAFKDGYANMILPRIILRKRVRKKVFSQDGHERRCNVFRREARVQSKIKVPSSHGSHEYLTNVTRVMFLNAPIPQPFRQYPKSFSELFISTICLSQNFPNSSCLPTSDPHLHRNSKTLRLKPFRMIS